MLASRSPKWNISGARAGSSRTGTQAQPRIAEEREAATPTEPDRTDAQAFGVKQVRRRRQHIHRAIEAQCGHPGAAALEIGLVVGQLHTAFDRVEHRWRDGNEPGRGKAFGDAADMRIDAENVLDQQHRAA